jgi:hypothetical protein
MNSVKKRGSGGRPNRGGGRGRGQPRPTPRGREPPKQQPANPASLARKSGAKDYDEDDLDIDDEDYYEEEESEDDEWYLDEEDDTDVVVKPKKDVAKPQERRKVEMQILHMSEQSQQMVLQMLKELHGSQYKMKDATSYRDAGQR